MEEGVFSACFQQLVSDAVIMKKIICLLLSICLIAVLAACGTDGGTTSAAEAVSVQGVSEAESEEAETSNPAAQTASDDASKEETETTILQDQAADKLLYLGHASLRITTSENKVIYIDPFAGEGYEPAADLILLTHAHYDHTATDLVANRNPDCRTITWEDSLQDGKHLTFELDYVTVESVEAGYNDNHNVNECVGYILTLSDGITVYVSGDTSKTEQMPSLADKKIDYAFFCCDGVYNMGPDEAAECASLIGAKHNIPYHVIPADEGLFDRGQAEQFQADNRLIIEPGQEIDLN